MKIDRIELRNFRNISSEVLEFHDKINIIHGRNGQGKTSILEAIFFLSITKSFRAKTEKIVLQHNQDHMQVEGNFCSDSTDKFSVRLFFSSEQGKHVFLNQNKLEKYSQLIGKIPITLLSLEDLYIAYGIPASRRKFIDILLSQISPLYLKALQEYRKSLAQRNKLLSLISEQKETAESLFAWDTQLVTHGTEIIRHRMRFAEFAREKLGDYYRKIALRDEQISLAYKTNIFSGTADQNPEQLFDSFKLVLTESRDADIQRQNTIKGPHRDDFVFTKDGYPLKSFGSQGENKTMLIALKLVESAFLKERSGENPILLMDDIFGELDTYRVQNLLSDATRFGQTFITTTSTEKFENLARDQVRYFEIEQGKKVA